MAYPNYYFGGYQQPNFVPQSNVYPAQQQSAQSTQNSGVLWCQGEAGAKAYPVSPNSSVLLMDSESPVMYIKSTDGSGMPLPLRIFDYTERKTDAPNKVINPTPTADYVSREEFDSFREEVMEEIKKNSKPYPTIRKTTKEEKELLKNGKEG